MFRCMVAAVAGGRGGLNEPGGEVTTCSVSGGGRDAGWGAFSNRFPLSLNDRVLPRSCQPAGQPIHRLEWRESIAECQ